MKKYLILNQLIISLINYFLFPAIGLTQQNKFSIGLRVPIQLEFQKEGIAYPTVLSIEEQRASVLNYGVDFLAEKAFNKKIGAYIGIGFLEINLISKSSMIMNF